MPTLDVRNLKPIKSVKSPTPAKSSRRKTLALSKVLPPSVAEKVHDGHPQSVKMISIRKEMEIMDQDHLRQQELISRF
jgi:hypothetical protein